MDEKKPKARRNDMIHCENCGEDYASTYKRCPFCDEANSTRGRRVSGSRGGGYRSPITPLRILTIVVPVALIVAAICIVITVVMPMIQRGNHGEPGESQSLPPNTESVSPEPTDSVPPTDSGAPEPSETTPVTVPSDVTGIKLNREDFTMSSVGETWNLQPEVTPAGATGTITWTSSDEAVAKVENGVVTAVGGGNCTVTATSGTATATCTGGATTTPSTGGTLTLNKSEFAITAQWPDPYTLKASGGSGTVTWSSSDTSVATVDANGKVTAVGNGKCTITAASGGQTATCTVWVSGK